jgi:hypothetical protein
MRGLPKAFQRGGNSEQQHKQTDNDPDAQMTLLPFAVVCTLRLA